jgi:hypothetical protein
MDYVIAIPSYHRSEICRDKTLTMLSKHHIPKEKIYVYIVKEDEEAYKKTCDVKQIIGKKGLVQQRQFIIEYFPEGKPIVFLDDDIEKVDVDDFKTLDHFIKEAFRITKEENAYIWGVYPVFNPFFRKNKPRITTCLNYIVGAFYGIINRRNPTLKLSLTKENGQKEDVERSLLYFKKDGVVIRFNRVGFVTKYYGKQGGLGTFEERLQPMKKASYLLKQKYPEYGTILTRKTGMTEFRLKKIKSTKKSKSGIAS